MNTRNRRITRSRLFAVTAPYTDVEKAFVYEALEDFCSKLCVSEEKHYNGLIHHHLFLKTNEALSLQEVKQIIGIVYNTNVFEGGHTDSEDSDTGDTSFAREFALRHGIHVTKVKSERNYLKYITKEDHNPMLKNIETKKLSFYYRAVEWANNTPEYEAADPFVLSHPQYYNLLKQVHSSVHNSHLKRPKQPLTRYVDPTLTQPVRALEASQEASSDTTETNGSLVWQQQVIEWWNDWIENGFRPKKKQLYLWGPSNTGKSHLIKQILRQCVPVTPALAPDILAGTNNNEYAYEDHVFRPTPHDERFAWESFDDKKFSVMVIDEFDIRDYNINDLKKILEGEPVIAGQKGASSRRIRLQMPMIFISNLELPNETDPKNARYTGLQSRFKIVRTHDGSVFQN